MASFIIKHTVGKQLEAAKGAVGGGGGDDDEKAAEEQAALEEQRREEEEKRKEKHRKMEAERETMRQEIRDKYNIKKREPGIPEPQAEGSLNRRRKTPAELAAEANQEEEESVLPAGLTDIQSKMTDLTGDVANKCVLQ